MVPQASYKFQHPWLEVPGVVCTHASLRIQSIAHGKPLPEISVSEPSEITCVFETLISSTQYKLPRVRKQSAYHWLHYHKYKRFTPKYNESLFTPYRTCRTIYSRAHCNTTPPMSTPTQADRISPLYGAL